MKLTTPLLDAALECTERGWPVFPLHHPCNGACSCRKPGCKNIGKHPRTKNGVKDAVLDRAQVDAWWKRYPSANVGIATGAVSNLAVIDIDPRHGGTESLAALEQEFGKLPTTVESLTGGRGRHLLFAYPGIPVSNRSNVRHGIDVRGDGGYIVAPPSWHSSGGQYCWVVGQAPGEIELAALPEWLLALIQKDDRDTAKVSAGAQVTGSPQTDHRYGRCLQSLLKLRTADRNDGSKRLFSAACRCVEFDLSDSDALSCLRSYITATPFPKAWTDDELRARLKDAEKQVQRGKQLTGPVIPPAQRDPDLCPYHVTERGTVWIKATKDGETSVPLMNFSAKIAGEVFHDDGVEQQLIFDIEASHRGRKRQFEVPANRFAMMHWATEQLGAGAILYPGQSIRDHARCAVQMLSGEIPRRVVFGHLGWREVGGEWVYLHAGGAVAANSSCDFRVDPPGPLQRFVLPTPPTRDELAAAFEASLRILDLTSELVTIPIWLAAYRAVLASADFSIFLCGHTGSGKSELAALAQQHFGAELDSRHLPANWSSTGNSLEALAFAAKDALLVVDDFAPGGTTADMARYHRDADRLLRAQGNQAGRARMTSDAQLRPAKPPRGLILSTGEDVPRGHSIRARSLILEMAPDGMDWQRLTACQAEAARGVYSKALAGFIQWVACNRNRILAERNQRVSDLRGGIISHGHKRTPALIAELAWTAELVEQFTNQAGIDLQSGSLFDRCWSALLGVAGAQAEHHAGADPVQRFQELLVSAVASGVAHVAATDGSVPDNAEAWGWREKNSSLHRYQAEWIPQGMRVGWTSGEDLFLDGSAAYKAAIQMASGETIPLQPSTLWKRMHERKLFRQVESPHLTVKRTVEGSRKRVLHLIASYLAPEVGQLGHVEHHELSADEFGAFRPTPLPQSDDANEFSGADDWGDPFEEHGQNEFVPHSPHMPQP